MPRSIRSSRVARIAVFAPLTDTGRAAIVEQRLTDAIVLGVLVDGERLPPEADLARNFGVATVTAREALESLRENGLIRTTRGRDGGSFVISSGYPHETIMHTRVRALSRVELRDMGVYYSAIASSAAELAADRSSGDDVENLERIIGAVDYEDAGATRRGEGRFHLELAALSQSARLVREELRLQAEFGPLLWLGMYESTCRARARDAHARIVEAISRVDGESARHLVAQHVGDALEWLVEHKAELERAAVLPTEHPDPTT
jgi:DNA-binding FadR family transcriptional regulator